MSPFLYRGLICLALNLGLFVQAQTTHRPPATPLVTHDPYFSIWSTTDKLTGGPTRHWTGVAEPLTSLARVDGKTYRVMGGDAETLPAMQQSSMELTPTHTRYTFHDPSSKVIIELTFFTPAFLDDLEILSRPVTYLTWTAKAMDGGQHSMSVFLTAGSQMASSYDGQPVVFSRQKTGRTEILSVGTRDQAVLNRAGDNLRIDWGYFHLAMPKGEQAESAISIAPEHGFALDGSLPGSDTMEGPVASGSRAPRLAAVFPLGTVGADPVSRHLLLSYTENYAIQYLQRNQRPYWQRNGKPVSTMLDEAEEQYAALDARGVAFDRELIADLTRSAGEHYAWLCTLAYRQAIAAHKLTADADGTPMLFSKENFSNGSIATVDVLYPSAPIFLFFNPKLLQAELLPVLQYASLTDRWRFPFAPHDLGVYPLANGQLYGGGEESEEDQMPVEESGNMLILVDALARTEHNAEMARQFWPLLTRWAEYLKLHGLDPERQLTTDDFAGHVAHNANLAIKAIDALEAYADLAALLQQQDAAKQYRALAKEMASKWIGLARDGDHFKLGYDSPGTWSQKYNLIWDKVLDYNLFPQSVRETEIAFYKKQLRQYGIPLDSRATYTKLDWELWTATLADSSADFNLLIDPVYRWTSETTSRVPMTDWYDTITGKQIGFQARSVVGGVFIKALDDKELARKWRERATK